MKYTWKVSELSDGNVGSLARRLETMLNDFEQNGFMVDKVEFVQQPDGARRSVVVVAKRQLPPTLPPTRPPPLPRTTNSGGRAKT